MVLVFTLAQIHSLHAKLSTCFQILSPYTKDTSRLLYEYHGQRDTRGPIHSEKLVFEGYDSKDVYNPTAPFMMNGEEILAGRVESRDSETDTKVVFFRKTSAGTWERAPGSPEFKMQDPFVTKIAGETVIGGVETFYKTDGSLGYRTIFYKGKTLKKLSLFATGPLGMKDIRLQELEDGKILLFTRPQGNEAGRGKIGAIEIDNLEQLTPQKISEATLLTPQFANGEWGGVNETHLLASGKIGVLGHVARFDAQGNRHYYPASFVFDPKNGSYSGFKILFERSDLPQGTSKRLDLQDVLFSGGLKRNDDGTADLYVGAGDAETYKVRIKDPFLDD